MIPGEREARGFKIRYLSWRRPVTYKIGFDIQSYGRLDGSPVSILEIENLIFINVRKEIIVDSKTEKVYSVLKKSKEMDGSSIAYRDFYLLAEKNGLVHVLNINVVCGYYQSSPEVRKVVKRIMDSFELQKDSK